MRAVNRSLLWLAVGSMSGALVAACTADAGSGSGIGNDDSGTGSDASGSSDASVKHDSSTHDASSGADTSTTPDTSTADTSTADTSVADTSTDTSTSDSATDAGADVVDAAVDAEAGLPPVGSPCPTVNQIQNQACGACGTQSRVCLTLDGGQPTWQAWGACQNEVVGGCIPGTSTSAACGLCGTQQKSCQNDCTWAVGACTGQPTNACSPGAIDYQPGLSCDAGGRERTCDMTCQWGNYGNCITFDGGGPLAVTIPFTVGMSTSKVVTLNTPLTEKLTSSSVDGACVVGTGTTGVSDYVEIFNPTNLTATVSVWLSPASSGAFDTIAALYPGVQLPPSNRTTCTRFNDDCSTSPCYGSLMSGFIAGTPDKRAVIAAGASVTLYIGTYASSTTSRDVTINARTDILQ